MTEEQKILWKKIKEFDLDEIDSSFTFTDRLARENGWTYEYAVRAIEEYKKFIFLICIGDQPMSPSDQVDQVWHLHLIYTYSYWIDFCKNTLKKDIHHGPTKGGKKEKTKHNNLYESTMTFYREIFNHGPPSDIWPSSETRFREIRFRRVNMHRNWVLPKIWKPS